MITVEQIEALLLKKIEGTDIFPVEVTVRQGNRITVYIDKYDGISMDECADINRYLNLHLDRDVEDYEMEVSSPGIGSSFKVKEQYIKHLNKNVEVVLKDGKKLKGKLLGYSDEGLSLELTGRDEKKAKSRKFIPQNINIDLNTIKTTKSIISFK